MVVIRMLFRTPRLRPSFDGDFDSLPRGSLQTLGAFERPRVLLCERDRYLFLCDVPEDLVGGDKDRHGSSKSEILFVELESDFRTVRTFWWIASNTWTFRPAKICWGVGNMGSAYLNSWRLPVDGTEKRFKMQVHRILGWTFLCPPDLSDWRWSEDFEFDQLDRDHTNNNLDNLKARDKREHRSLSGQFGGRPLSADLHHADDDDR